MNGVISLQQLPGHDVLTHSRMACMKTCERKHYYAYELGVRPGGEAAPLRMGAAVHKGLELMAKGVPEHEAIAQTLADCGYDERPTWATSEELEAEHQIEARDIACMLAGYAWRWQETVIARYIAVEQAFRVPIRNPETGAATRSFVLAGKIDAVVELNDGRVAAVEHKTTSDDISPDSDYWTRLRIDQQISAYWLGAKSLGYKIDTVLYDVLRKPRIDARKVPLADEQGFKIVVDLATGERVANKDGSWRQSGDAAKGWAMQTRRETPDEYQERLLADMTARPDFYFARQEIPRLNADLEEFELELWWQQQAMRERHRTGRWVRNTGACIGFGKCAYLNVCHSGIRIGESLPSGFRQVERLHEEL